MYWRLEQSQTIRELTRLGIRLCRANILKLWLQYPQVLDKINY